MVGLNIHDEWAIWCMRVHGARAVDYAMQGYERDAKAEARTAASDAIYFLSRWEERGNRKVNWSMAVVRP